MRQEITESLQAEVTSPCPQLQDLRVEPVAVVGHCQHDGVRGHLDVYLERVGMRVSEDVAHALLGAAVDQTRGILGQAVSSRIDVERRVGTSRVSTGEK